MEIRLLPFTFTSSASFNFTFEKEKLKRPPRLGHNLQSGGPPGRRKNSITFFEIQFLFIYIERNISLSVQALKQLCSDVSVLGLR